MPVVSSCNKTQGSFDQPKGRDGTDVEAIASRRVARRGCCLPTL
jgi:hypothetical protein